jgi:magnesium chelatase accessory protein
VTGARGSATTGRVRAGRAALAAVPVHGLGADPARERKREHGVPRTLDFDRDGVDWPNRAASRIVEAGGLRWHVQVMGEGPPILLLHGTGASTHSWRDLLPLLARHHTVVAPDLPGHGFTQTLPLDRMTLPGMAAAVAALLAALDITPVLGVGHSAGAAILIRMVLDRKLKPAAIVSLNGALLPFGGLAGRIFSPVAKLLALNPFVPRLFAWRAAESATIDRLLGGTGSRIDPRGTALYARLAQDRRHVGAAIAMMAGWDLDALAAQYRRLDVPVVLVACSEDGMVPASQAFAVRDAMARAEVVFWRGLGHLGHEEAPDRFAALIEEIAARDPASRSAP